MSADLTEQKLRQPRNVDLSLSSALRGPRKGAPMLLFVAVEKGGLYFPLSVLPVAFRVSKTCEASVRESEKSDRRYLGPTSASN